MALIIKSMAFTILLVMLISGVVYGDEIRAPSEVIPGVYKPETMNQENPNLLIGGINQKGSNPDQNPGYKEIAKQLGAMYIPTYYSGDEGKDAAEVNYAASWSKTYIYPDGSTYKASYQNGLKNNELNDETYNTIIAYSGGTTTAVTALDKQIIKCHTLILISPMRGTPYETPLIPIDTRTTLTETDQDKLYKEQIKRLLHSGNVQRIVVIQSSDDQLTAGSFYQARFKKGEISGVDVSDDIDLKTMYSQASPQSETAMSTVPIIYTYTGEQAHKDLFFKYARDHLKLGSNGRVYYMPNGVYSNPPTVQDYQVKPQPPSITLGESLTISYTVSDNSGTGLKQVELWRKDEQSDWQEIKPSNTLASENGPISGSFTDSPSAPGKYWYGVHVVDNIGNWNDEKNSNTNNPSISFGPVEVEVKEAKSITPTTLLAVPSEPDQSAASNPSTSRKLYELKHGNSVSSVAFSPDSHILASASDDGMIKLWDVSTGTEIRTLEIGKVNCIAFSPDGSTLASASDDSIIKLWDISTGTEIRTLESGKVKCIAFSPDGSTLASCGSSKSPCSGGYSFLDCLNFDTTILWDVSTGNEIRRLYGHSSGPISVAFSPDGQTLAVGGDFTLSDGFIQMWDVSTGTEIRRVKSDRKLVFSIAFSPDGRLLASGGYYGDVTLCEVSTGNETMNLDGGVPNGFAKSVAFSSDGHILASGVNANGPNWGNIKLWDVSTGAEIQTLEEPQYIFGIAFSPDGSMLASCGSRGFINLWRIS